MKISLSVNKLHIFKVHILYVYYLNTTRACTARHSDAQQEVYDKLESAVLEVLPCANLHAQDWNKVE